MGCEVEVWTTPIRGSSRAWWLDLRSKKRELERYLAQAGSFDVVDTVSWAMSARLRKFGSALVVRNVQPDLAYLSTASARPSRSMLHRVAHTLNEKDTRRLILKGWRSADVIFALGTSDAREMASTHLDLADRIRAYGIAPDQQERIAFRMVAERRSRGRVGVSDARYLWIGRWTDHKGTDVLLRFAESFLAENPRSSLTVAGGGPESTRAVGRLGLSEGRLRTIEQFDRAELPAILEQHNVGLFTSRVEGWGLSLQEMLESGMPVFATRAGAVEDLEPWFEAQLQPFPPRTGVELPPPIDAESFERYADCFSWKRIAKRYLDQIREVRERRTSPTEQTGRSVPSNVDRSRA